MNNTLIFPAGIHLAEPHEIMGGPERDGLIEKRCHARIEQGYVIHTSENTRFSFYAEINVDAPQIWPVFRSLCEALLAEKATPMIGAIDEEPLHNGKYDSVPNLLSRFEPFEYYLVNDCFIQFGLAARSQAELTEVFVTPTKHFQIWMSKVEVFKTIMDDYHIPLSEKLQFINGFPRVTSPLKYETAFHDYDDLIDHLVEVTGEQ